MSRDGVQCILQSIQIHAIFHEAPEKFKFPPEHNNSTYKIDGFLHIQVICYYLFFRDVKMDFSYFSLQNAFYIWKSDNCILTDKQQINQTHRI